MGVAIFLCVWIALGSVALFKPRYAYFMFMNPRRRPGQPIRPEDLAGVPASTVSFYRIIGGAMCLIGVVALVVVLVTRA